MQPTMEINSGRYEMNHSGVNHVVHLLGAPCLMEVTGNSHGDHPSQVPRRSFMTVAELVGSAFGQSWISSSRGDW